MTRRLAPLACVAIVFVCAPAVAQETRSFDPPAHLSFVDGAATLERDGQIETSPGSMPLLAGDRVRTQGGRVEALFADGSALHMDANTVLDFQSDEVVRLLDGRIRLSIVGPRRAVDYRVDGPSAWVQITDVGEYRISVIGGDAGRQVELAVIRGAAELVNENGRSELRAGERAFAGAGNAPSPPYVFNSAAWDDFDRWSEGRRDQRLGASAQYLPEDVRPYTATFDTYGSWRHEPTYGYVWYPRAYAGWRPYYRGRWASLHPYGWTWITHDPWGWPTHHYGRWGFSAGAWFWIPGRTWGPAWVSWAYSPGYVSWCPLGWNNRAVLHLNANFHGGHRYYPWRAWTAVPRHHFRGSYVNVGVIASTRVDARRYGTFVEGRGAPEVRYATPRAAAPIRAAGGAPPRYAVPRGSAGTSFSSRAAVAPSAATSPADASVSRSSGFPPPARAPRTPSATARRSPEAPVTVPPGTARAVPRRDSPATAAQGDRDREGDRRGYPETRRAPPSSPGTEYRAQPRYRSQPETRPQPGTASPAYRAPDAARPEYRAPTSRAPEYRAPEYRAPEYRRPEYRAPASAPRSDPGVRRAPEATPPASERARPMPRGGDAPSYRAAPERRGPSGPPPSAAPSRGQAPAAGQPSRSSGGQASQGRARPRG